METNFVEGLYFNKPHEKAPDFVKGSISIKKDQFTQWVATQPTNDKGYIKIDVLLSKKDTLYLKVNDYGINKTESVAKEVFKGAEIDKSNLPF